MDTMDKLIRARQKINRLELQNLDLRGVINSQVIEMGRLIDQKFKISRVLQEREDYFYIFPIIRTTETPNGVEIVVGE